MKQTPHVITARISIPVSATTVIITADISYDYRHGEPPEIDFAGAVLVSTSEMPEPPTDGELAAMAKDWLDDLGYLDACTRAQREQRERYGDYE